MKHFARLVTNSEASTAIEYGLIAALIAVGIMTAVAGVGSNLNTSYSRTSSAVVTATS